LVARRWGAADQPPGRGPASAAELSTAVRRVEVRKWWRAAEHAALPRDQENNLLVSSSISLGKGLSLAFRGGF